MKKIEIILITLSPSYQVDALLGLKVDDARASKVKKLEIKGS
jgi:hypothetical protein